MTRVQIPAYRDEWMQGDRYGEIVKVTKGVSRAFKPIYNYELAYVRLDKSGRVRKFILDDCTVVS